MADLSDINDEDMNSIAIELNQGRNSNLRKSGENSSDSCDVDILFQSNNNNNDNTIGKNRPEAPLGVRRDDRVNDGPQISAISGLSTNVNIGGVSTNTVNTGINNDQMQMAQALSASMHTQLSQSPASPQNNDIALIKEEMMKSKYRRQLMWKSILMFVLMVHSFCLIYLLFIKDDSCTCSNDNSDDGSDSLNQNGDDYYTSTTTSVPSTTPEESQITTTRTATTTIPQMTTQQPSNSPSTNSPSITPTSTPTNMPTLYDGWSVGDFKMSFMNQSHDYWLLCDGSFIDLRFYPLLFDVIGYTFGDSPDSNYLFALPNVTDRVIGFAGGSGNNGDYMVGDYFGSENKSISLEQDNIPSHYHYIMTTGSCDAEWSGSSIYLSQYCWDSAEITTANNYYNLHSSSSSPSQGESSSVGQGTEIVFNVQPPTLVIGHVFVYSGQSS